MAKNKEKRRSEAKRPEVIVGDQVLADRYHVSTRTIAAWRAAGMPCSNGENRQYVYSVALCDPWVALQRRQNDSAETNTAQRLRLAREGERLKQDRFKAEQMQRDAAVAQGNMLPRDEWELFATEVVQLARDRFMRIPIDLCKSLPRKYHRKIREDGEAIVRKICLEMSRGLEAGPKDVSSRS